MTNAVFVHLTNKKQYLCIPLIFMVFTGCSSIAKVKLYGNSSVGDSYSSEVSPEGIVREVSNKYQTRRLWLFTTGTPGDFVFKFKATAEGEADIVFFNSFRAGEPSPIASYKAVVDKWKRLTLTLTDMSDEQKEKQARKLRRSVY